MDETVGITCGGCGNSVAAASRFCSVCGQEFFRISPGEILDGKYEILGKIGEGGMGEVFRARHLHLDDIRIIKVMKTAGLDDATQQRRFTEEARLATRLRHPNVAALYDFAKLPTGAFYMVWEYIDGETLLHRLRRFGTIEVEEAVEIALDVLAGLSEIHHAGVVHRDISPDNIMIVEKNGRRVAKVIDLGIAKKVAGERLGMTATGMFLGKLKYCSPEQAGSLPASESVDGRSDLYSLGCVLYEMLAGAPPFQSPTPEGFLAKHLQEKPPPLPAGNLPPEIAAPLSSIVSRALEKNRLRRFQSAAEFASALSTLRPAMRTLAAVPTARGAGELDSTVRLDDLRTETTALTPAARTSRRITLAVLRACVAIGILAIGFSWWRTSPSPRKVREPRPALKLSGAPPPATASSTSTPANLVIEDQPTEPSAPRHRGPEETPRPPKRLAPPPAPKPAILPPSPAVAPPAPAPDESAALRRLEELKIEAPKGSQAETELHSRVVQQERDVIPVGVLEHAPVRFAPKRSEIEISAIWPGAPAGVKGTIFYRSRLAPEWRRVPMKAGPEGSLTGRIPGEAVVAPFVGYYLEAQDSEGHVRQKGSALSPLRIRVSRR